LTKAPKTCYGEKTTSSTNVAGKTGYLPAKKQKLDPCISPCTSINTKWITHINIRPETLKLAQERAGNTLEMKAIGNDFLSKTQVAQQQREKINKCDNKKLKTPYKKRNAHQIEEAAHRIRENICQLYT
jgi:hypothetical protein